MARHRCHTVTGLDDIVVMFTVAHHTGVIERNGADIGSLLLLGLVDGIVDTEL